MVFLVVFALCGRSKLSRLPGYVFRFFCERENSESDVSSFHFERSKIKASFMRNSRKLVGGSS
jgi:hypothetical protein